MKIPYTYKGILYLAGLFVLAPLFVWQLALKGTAGLAGKYRKERKEFSLLEQTAPAKDSLTVAETDFDYAEQIESGLLLNTLLPVAEQHRVKIENYTPFVSDRRGNMVMRTAEVTLAGGYIPLVRVIDSVERAIPHCRLLSATFHTVKNRRDKTTELKTVLLIQQLTEQN